MSPRPRAIHWYERPIVWWRRHPWIPVWLAVMLTPGALLGLRFLDDSAIAFVVQPIVALMIVLFLVIVAVAVRRSVRHSRLHAGVGGGGALLAVALLAVPMTYVMGTRSCPDHMGPDRGLQVSMQMLNAWRSGKTPPLDVWSSPAVGDAWRARVRTLALTDYRLVDSGCWERLAPVATGQTWHQYRVTVQRGAGEGFSKIVTVHTTTAHGEWVITEIEGPEL